MSNKETAVPQKRVLSLDALRGFAILTMVLSGLVPHGNDVIPAWMFHAQNPPPLHHTDITLPGITWVDLVFPFFLFSMGAAIPLAISRRLEKGMPVWRVLLGMLERGILLGFFAIYIQHIQPWTINSSPTKLTHFIVLLGFLLLFPIYTRFPQTWNKWLRLGLKAGGWIGAIILLFCLRCSEVSGFSITNWASIKEVLHNILYRSDIIIIVLANMAVFGTLFWLITRTRLLWRLGIIGIFLAIQFAYPVEGWVQYVFKIRPIPWIYNMYYLKYLLIVLPGTIAGDIILGWMKKPEAESGGNRTWSVSRLTIIAVLMVAFQIVNLVGLFVRHVPETVVICLIMSIAGWWLFRNPGNDTEKMMKTLFVWGVYWLLLGLAFEPYEGGIKKSNSTISYYFVTSGLAIFLMLAFMVIGDVFKKKRWLSLLVYNGQNPMIAYRGAQSFVIPVFALTGLNKVYDYLTGGGPWQGLAGGCFVVLLVALLTMWLSKKKIYWRT